jgi:hypothetical protein
MTLVDIPADLNSEDETGLVWTFLDEADDPSIIKPGEVVVADSPLTPTVCEVVDLVDRPAGTIVHLRVLPGTIEQYRRLLSAPADSRSARRGRLRVTRRRPSQ